MTRMRQLESLRLPAKLQVKLGGEEGVITVFYQHFRNFIIENSQSSNARVAITKEVLRIVKGRIVFTDGF